MTTSSCDWGCWKKRREKDKRKRRRRKKLLKRRSKKKKKQMEEKAKKKTKPVKSCGDNVNPRNSKRLKVIDSSVSPACE